jgi:CPA1 family monovalent cation:H+ antiporter
MSKFEFVSVLLLLIAAIGIVNHRYVGLPRTIGLLAGSLVLSVIIILIDQAVDAVELRVWWRDLVVANDLPHAFLDCALAFMLFAGTLHVDLSALRAQKWTVLALATVGVSLATVLYGVGIWFVFAGSVPFLWCLTLGSVLAPTDPVAVGGLLRDAGLPAGPLALVNGESLFNDGVAVVLFSVILGMANGQDTTAGAVLKELLVEAGGGIALGLVAGYLAYLALALVDDAALELIITLALVSVSYSLAHALHMSGPLAVVVAGLLTSYNTQRRPMSEATLRTVIGFWDLADELLNGILFLLLGFALLSIEINRALLVAGLAGIVLALLTRLVSVSIPTVLIHLRQTPVVKSVVLLTWGGLRGGISVALALTLDPSPYRDALLAVCYAVVVFTIIVQGLSMPRLVRFLYNRPTVTEAPL